jgi:antitoxin ParD1/3/4
MERLAMNVNLGTQWETFINDNVKTGRYLSASEVVRDGLRLLLEHKQLRQLRLEELRKEVGKGVEALDRGDYIDLDEAGIKTHFQDLEKRGRQRLARKKKAAAK